MNNISVIGLGYIGLPTAAMFASKNMTVYGVDVNQPVVDTINSGQIHIVEPNLLDAVKHAVENGQLKAGVTPKPADAFIVAVPTPFKKDTANDAVPQPDLSYVHKAAISIAPVLKSGDLIILESTSPVGATEKMADWLSELRPDLNFPQHHGEKTDIHIAYCPERVLPGNVMNELVTNDRIIGGITEACAQKAADLYRVFVKGKCLIASGPRVAELTKLTENSFRDVNIAFANELSFICDKLDISVWELIQLANRHPRVNILQPGPGVGGHCIAVDPWFIVSSAPEQSKIISLARNVNDSKPAWVLGKVDMAIELYREQNSIRDRKIEVACYGIAFKPDIDDFRESPSLQIAEVINQFDDVNLSVVEPNIDQKNKSLFEQFNFATFEQAKSNSDIHVMLVDHSQFKGSQKPKGFVIDTRGVWE